MPRAQAWGNRNRAPRPERAPRMQDREGKPDMTDDERREAGERMRRQVLSDSYVDARRANASAFTRDLEDVITRFA